MAYLIIGLGSMGKRRVRCLQALNVDHSDIYGYDINENRRAEALSKYYINVVDDLTAFDFSKVDALIISTPPDLHNRYIELAINEGKSAFVEASVVIGNLKVLSEKAKEKGVRIFPSCTMLFHPAIELISQLVTGKKYGKVTSFTYHSGQYLPDWHPWEKPTEFYVGNKDTGAAREIVPFELTWMVEVLGFPTKIKGFFGKTMDVGADIDDSYALSLDYGDSFGTLCVDCVSRYATRYLILNLEMAQIRWDWDETFVRLYTAENEKTEEISFKMRPAESGYNSNITEDMYIDEIAAFINGDGYPNDLDRDIKVLELLLESETRN